MMPTEIETYNTREADQEIDAVEICPANANYVVIATYHLVKKEDEGDAPADRVGSLQIKSFKFDALYEDEEILGRLDLPCAILDIRFHPQEDTLLAAATSLGEIRLFWVDVNDEAGASRIDPIGIMRVSDSDTDTPPPLITQFTWLSGKVSAPSDLKRVVLATCDTSGTVKLVEILYPTAHEYSDEATKLKANIELVHTHLHSLEAWTISAIQLPEPENREQDLQLILSGGDDSCLIASTCNTPTIDEADEQQEPHSTRLWIDRSTHQAGVVSILPLKQLDNQTVPFLTGSYDNNIRLHLLDINTRRKTEVSSLELEGGVWRIAVVDTYTTSQTNDDNNSNTTATTTTLGNIKQHHTILLVCAMYAGAYILRLTHSTTAHNTQTSPEHNEQQGDWQFSVEARFTRGHNSMVYAAVAMPNGWTEADNKPEGKVWEVLSTSFYDKKICNWHWVDEGRPVVYPWMEG